MEVTIRTSVDCSGEDTLVELDALVGLEMLQSIAHRISWLMEWEVHLITPSSCGPGIALGWSIEGLWALGDTS